MSELNPGATLGVCGLGLIGASIARSWIERGPVVALDPDPTAREQAELLGVRTVDSLEALAGVDLLVLAAPTAVNLSLLRNLIARPDRTVTMDIGSVKSPIIAAWQQDRPGFPFVGTHPMAGSELAGFSAGRADLFEDASWPVVVTGQTDPGALLAVLALILHLGARPVPVSAAAHDRAVAEISHLPHLLAGALGHVVSQSQEAALARQLAAGSFRDVSRVSASPPERTAEFMTANRLAVADRARRGAAELLRAADLLEAADEAGLVEWLRPGERVRAGFEDRHQQRSDTVLAGSAAEVCEALSDRRDTGARVLGASRTRSGWELEFAEPGGWPNHD